MVSYEIFCLYLLLFNTGSTGLGERSPAWARDHDSVAKVSTVQCLEYLNGKNCYISLILNVSVIIIFIKIIAMKQETDFFIFRR